MNNDKSLTMRCRTPPICALFRQHYQPVTDINGSPFDPFLLKAKTCSTPPEAAPVCTTARLTHPLPRQTRLGKEKSEPLSRSANSAQLRLQMRNRRRESGSSLIWFLSVYTCQFAALADGQTGERRPRQLLGDGQRLRAQLED